MGLSANPVRFGVNPRGLAYEKVVAIAKAGEAAGFDIISFADQPPEDLVEGWTLATAVGVQTSKINITHGTLNVPYRNPALVANMAASLDNITGGRVTLTIGAGGQEGQANSYGMPFGSSGERFIDLRDAVAIMRGLWCNEEFSYQGRAFTVEAATVRPKPVSGSVPIVIGASGPQMLRYTGRVAEGWLKNGGWPESHQQYQGMMALMEEGANRAGRDPATIHRHLNGIGYIGEEDPATVIPQIRAGRTRGLLGTADTIIESIEEWAGQGVDTFRLQFPAARAEEQIRRFGEEVIARWRG